ncbi:hypothetical protein [Novosphingobium sp. RL4]|uniref:hypothetical protein n=1 Tax=Novosphingobium sp. RL4 TaxID=3109595 RepID=UPI002D76B932|nr:hypothetical protein [Novosphingobium sp. RL4]WRT91359.1 hypothetical protein U9J33_08955 [Novosphingobium sp. RL4]
MATYYAKQQIGVADSTVFPVKKADGREVNAKRSEILATKPAGQALAAADKLYLGTKKAGDKIVGVRGNTDTSLATATVSIGTLAAPAKYVNAATLTATNVPTMLGPLASTLAADQPVAEEDIYATFAVAGVAGAVNLSFELELIGL